MAQQRVAVVGAGLAGLAAALALKDAGAHVELFERGRLLGGRATSFEIDGVEVDNGQHVFLACCTGFVDFARRIGMADRLHVQPRFDALVLARDGTAGRLRSGMLPAPLHLAGSFARYPHLGLGGKLQVARALIAGLRRSRNGGGTFESWLDENGQTARTRSAFWDPFFIPALNAPFDRVDKNDAMFVLSTAFLKDAGAARFGFATVPLAHFAAAAAREIDAVHLSTAVTAVTSPCHPERSEREAFAQSKPVILSTSTTRAAHAPLSTGCASRSDAQSKDELPCHPERSEREAFAQSKDAPPCHPERSEREAFAQSKDESIVLHLLDGRTEAFDGVVLAVPPRVLSKLLGDPQRYGLSDLDAFDVYPIVDVHLWHDAGSIGFDFAAALESPLQWIFEKAPGYLCCSFSAADEYLRMPTAELETLAWNEAGAFLPALRTAKLVRSAVTRNPEATYLPRLGVQRPEQRTAVPGVAIAGAWTKTGWPDTMESAVRSGRSAARALVGTQ